MHMGYVLYSMNRVKAYKHTVRAVLQNSTYGTFTFTLMSPKFGAVSGLPSRTSFILFWRPENVIHDIEATVGRVLIASIY